MDIKSILNKCDHTLLKQTATREEIIKLCDEAKRFGTASVCIPPCYVKLASDYLKGAVKVCTVIGFPNGNNTIESKVFETADAVKNGTDEIDMVINIGELKAGNTKYVLDEIIAVRNACQGKILKVIIETCLLTEEEKIKMCAVVSESGADYIKTSTGFSTGGATVEDIKLFAKYITNGLKIKAAGGIAAISDAEEFINLGASRLGTSRIVKIAIEDAAKERN